MVKQLKTIFILANFSKYANIKHIRRVCLYVMKYVLLFSNCIKENGNVWIKSDDLY